MEGYNSKIRKVSKCRPAVSNETILATRQELFLTKVAPVKSITDIVLLDFWLMPFSWMIISSSTTTYFYVKIFIFFECLYFCEYDIRMPLYGFWLRKGPSIKYLRNWYGDLEVIQNAYNWVKREEVSHLMCTCALTLSLFMFLTAFISHSVMLCL